MNNSQRDSMPVAFSLSVSWEGASVAPTVEVRFVRNTEGNVRVRGARQNERAQHSRCVIRTMYPVHTKGAGIFVVVVTVRPLDPLNHALCPEGHGAN